MITASKVFPRARLRAGKINVRFSTKTESPEAEEIIRQNGEYWYVVGQTDTSLVIMAKETGYIYQMLVKTGNSRLLPKLEVVGKIPEQKFQLSEQHISTLEDFASNHPTYKDNV